MCDLDRLPDQPGGSWQGQSLPTGHFIRSPGQALEVDTGTITAATGETVHYPVTPNLHPEFQKKSFLELSHNDPLSATILPIQWVLAMDRWIRRIESSKIKSPVSPLILQGTFDRTVDAKHNIAVLEKLYTQPSVYYLEDARHHLPNELDETIDDYLSWLTSKLNAQSA